MRRSTLRALLLFGFLSTFARAADGPAAVLGRADARLGTRNVAFPSIARGEEPDRTLAPYFAVAGGDGAERLPLEETSAQVEVAGVIAKVTVRQVFRNSGKTPIVAIYVFPASTRAAVHGMRMRIGERTVEARIERRDEARARYDAARQEGRRAALLEQERPNVFTMSVANVMPGDRIATELEYSELLVPEAGTYELVFPAVVGPRYGGGADPAEDGWLANPYLRAGAPTPYRWDFRAHLETAIGLKDVSSPSHPIAVSYRSPSSADVRLEEAGGGDRDLVLRWRLAGEAIETGVLLSPTDAGGGYFLALVEPPARVAASEIPPREYVFVLDVSGSMHGFPLETAKALMRSLLPRLRPVDAFNVVFFSGGSFVLSPDRSLPATEANVRRAIEAIDGQRGGGGTELMQALRTAYALPRADDRVSRSVVVVTDGYVAVEAQAFRFVREHLDEANAFAFGIGSSVNRGLVEALARAGQGEPFVVLAPEKARGEADRFAAMIERPVLSRLSYRFDGLAARDVAPARLPDLLAERPVVLFGRYEGEPRGRIVISGRTAGGRFERALDVRADAARPENAALRALWARRWVELLSDEEHLAPAKEIEDAIAELGLAHRLLTAHTSFVAVDSEVVNRGGDAEAVKQPLPLPRGVSELAVGEAAVMRAGGVARLAVRAIPPGVAPHVPAPLRGRGEAGRADAVERKAAASEPASAPVSVPPPVSTPTGDRARATSPTVEIRGEEAHGVADLGALRGAVRSALLRAAAAGTLRGRLELRLTLDGAGKVAKVEVLSTPDASMRAAVENALLGISSGARPGAGASATWRFTAVFGA